MDADGREIYCLQTRLAFLNNILSIKLRSSCWEESLKLWVLDLKWYGWLICSGKRVWRRWLEEWRLLTNNENTDKIYDKLVSDVTTVKQITDREKKVESQTLRWSQSQPSWCLQTLVSCCRAENSLQRHQQQHWNPETIRWYRNSTVSIKNEEEKRRRKRYICHYNSHNTNVNNHISNNHHS